MARPVLAAMISVAVAAALFRYSWAVLIIAHPSCSPSQVIDLELVLPLVIARLITIEACWRSSP